MAKEKEVLKKKKGDNYESDDIDMLRFPDAIRHSPGMYIGSVDAHGKWVTLKELLDNALDEALAGRNDYIGLHVDKAGNVWVVDEGIGIPQGTKKYKVHTGKKTLTVEMPTMQAVFSELHTSGKFRDKAYARSIGTHGVGSKATNATAATFDVWTCFKDKWYHIGFEKGIIVSPVAKTKAPKLWNGKKPDHGTVVKFKHDETIFKKAGTAAGIIAPAKEWAEVMSYLNAGLTIEVSEHGDKKPTKFYSKEGPKDYIKARLATHKADAEATLFEFTNGIADVILSFSTYSECDLRGYTNGSYNRDGGKHVDAVTSSLYKALVASDVKAEKKAEKLRDKVKAAKTARAKAKARAKEKEAKGFSETDVREGLVGLIDAKLHKPMFNSQDKVKLADDRMGTEFRDELTQAFTDFFLKHKSLAARLREKAEKLSELKSKFTASKQAVADLNKMKRSGISAKYAPPNKRIKPEDCELFIVEGDSAAGNIRQLRRPNQGLMPLKGKVMNALKKTADQVLASIEPLSVLAGIGFDPKAKDPIAKLSYGRIICLADPDPDGPFVGDTKIRVRRFEKPNANGEVKTIGHLEHEQKIAALKEWTDQGLGFEVPVHIGGSEHWRPATARHVADVKTLVALEIGNTKYKVSESHLFVVVRTPATRGRLADADELAAKGYPDMGDTLAFIRAKDLRVGDRVWTPANEGGRKPDFNKQDKVTGRGFLAVNKARVQELSEAVPVYCLEVPKHHHFILPSGIVSGNCHINTLLLGLMYKFVPELIDRGMVYVSNFPLFYAQHGTQLHTGDTLSEVQKKLKAAKAPASVKVSRIKGLGEVDASMLDILALDPKTRRLTQVKPLTAEDRSDFVRIMGEDVAYRKEMLGIEGRREKDVKQNKKDAKTLVKKPKKAKAKKAKKDD